MLKGKNYNYHQAYFYVELLDFVEWNSSHKVFLCLFLAISSLVTTSCRSLCFS